MVWLVSFLCTAAAAIQSKRWEIDMRYIPIIKLKIMNSDCENFQNTNTFFTKKITKEIIIHITSGPRLSYKPVFKKDMNLEDFAISFRHELLLTRIGPEKSTWHRKFIAAV